MAVAGFFVCAVALAQDPLAAPASRFGVKPAPEAYPQATVKEALASATKAIEKDRVEYLAAHLLDAKVVDSRVDERAAQLQDVVEKEFRLRRDEQVRAGVPRGERLPGDAREFAEAVRDESRQRAFRAVVRDVRLHLSENPESLGAFRRYLRDGAVAEAADTATVTLKGVKDQLQFRKAAGRWQIEDRKSPEPVEKK